MVEKSNYDGQVSRIEIEREKERGRGLCPDNVFIVGKIDFLHFHWHNVASLSYKNLVDQYNLKKILLRSGLIDDQLIFVVF